MSRRWINARTSLAALVFVLIVASLLPSRLSSRIAVVREPLVMLVAPAQSAAAAATRWLRSRSEPVEDEELAAYRARLDEAQASYLQQRAINEDLMRQIEEMRAGLAMNPGLPVRQVVAPVIGSSGGRSSSVLRVRAGSADGVIPGSVAVAGGVHLIGRVVEVKMRYSSVLPITDRAAGQLLGVVMLDDSTQGPMCALAPAGDGTLVGPAEHLERAGSAAEPEVGMTVRLRDDAWPRSAQMLVVGKVVAVRPAEDQPLRRIVVVRPERPADRVSEVSVRIHETASDALPPSRAGDNAETGGDGG